MSRDINDISKEIMKNNKQIHDMDKNISKDIEGIHKEIQNVKKDIKNLSTKIDLALEILNTLTIFIEDAEHIIEDDDNDEEYQSNEGWLPEVNNWEDNYDDEDNE